MQWSMAEYSYKCRYGTMSADNGDTISDISGHMSGRKVNVDIHTRRMVYKTDGRSK